MTDPMEPLVTAYETGWHTQDGKPGANSDTRHRAGLRAVSAVAVADITKALLKYVDQLDESRQSGKIWTYGQIQRHILSLLDSDERGQIVVMNPYRATVNSELTVRPNAEAERKRA